MSNKKAKGKRAKTRSKMKKRGAAATVNKLLASFDSGQRVCIVIDSSQHSGLPHSKYQGYTGIVTGRQGKLYKVAVKDDSNTRNLLVAAPHLQQTVVKK